jgi:dolichyl-phosphate-mannose--protein O-mannosyl transferase
VQLCASFGAALPMLVYGIMCELDFSVEACVIAASMLIFGV